MSERGIETLVLAIAGLYSGVACRENTPERAEATARRLREGARVAQTDVVRALEDSNAAGQIIYDVPTDLSYATARATRPDLVPR